MVKSCTTSPVSPLPWRQDQRTGTSFFTTRLEPLWRAVSLCSMEEEEEVLEVVEFRMAALLRTVWSCTTYHALPEKALHYRLKMMTVMDSTKYHDLWTHSTCTVSRNRNGKITIRSKRYTAVPTTSLIMAGVPPLTTQPIAGNPCPRRTKTCTTFPVLQTPHRHPTEDATRTTT